MPNTNDTLWLQFAIELFEPLLLAIGTLLAGYAVQFIRTHIANAQLRALGERLTEATSLAVHKVEATLVREFKKNVTTKLPKEAAKDALEAAVTQAREYLGTKGIETAKQVLGKDDASLDRILRAAIEREVARTKALPIGVIPEVEP